MRCSLNNIKQKPIVFFGQSVYNKEKRKRKRVITMTAMTIERAVDNAIASTKMEGFAITEKHKELIMKLMKKEITLEEALKELNKKG